MMMSPLKVRTDEGGAAVAEGRAHRMVVAVPRRAPSIAASSPPTRQRRSAERIDAAEAVAFSSKPAGLASISRTVARVRVDLVAPALRRCAPAVFDVPLTDFTPRRSQVTSSTLMSPLTEPRSRPRALRPLARTLPLTLRGRQVAVGGDAGERDVARDGLAPLRAVGASRDRHVAADGLRATATRGRR